ncbi:MAG TPA: chromate efflux transporter, partial [Thermomicrobiales bacterium]|nr:chromate efflux transporter [Thermomicrobiales bacterium]
MNPRLKAVVLLALQLGFTAFGGPAAHIAMLREQAVVRRKWLTEQEYLDLLGVTNLIPGPNSTEMVMHVGYRRGGWPGLVLAGSAFILPAASITLVFAWLYVEAGTTTQGEWILKGIKPVVLAVVLQAVWNLGLTAVKDRRLAAVGVAVFGLYLLGINEIALLFGGALVAAGSAWIQRRFQSRERSLPTLGLAPLPLIPALLQMADPAVSYSAWRLFLGFLKIGALLYGSGYVLVAFLQSEFVDRLRWITEQQLLDAVAVGQFTP